MTEQDILIMNSDSTHVDVELSFDNGVETIKNNGIYSESMSLIDSISDSESIVFGKCNISQFQVKVADFEGNIDGALMNVLLKFSNAELGECEYNLGQYIVSDSERTSDKMFRIITAYDKMSLFNKDIANWYNYTLFPFEVVDNNLGWLPVNENGVVIDLTYSVAGEPQTSLDKNDDGAYYLNTNDGIVYVGYATYDESGEFTSVEWRTYLQCEKNESYTESCNITRTVNEILAMLCEYVGVPYNTDFVLVNGGITVGRDYNPQSLNGLDFLQQICELNGVFGHINNNGILDFIAPDKSKKQIVDTFKKCDYSEYTVQPINSVSIKHDSNDMGTTVTRHGIDKLNQYEIVGNIFLQSIKREDELNTIAEKILSEIENVTYVPCSVEVKCGLNFELGDYITVNAKTIKEESVSSVSFDTLVLCRNISGIQSIFNKIEANGTEYVNKNAESLSSQLQITNKTIDKLYKEYTANAANFMHLYSKAITTDSLSANVANIGTLNANSAFVKFITGDVINANYIRSLTADIGYLDADMANIDFANLNKSNIGQLFANVGLISSATITDGHVTGYLDSVEVNANKITAGTLAVDRLLIKDSSGNYKMATYDSSGNLVTTTVNGSVITNRTITADHLVAGTITANEINMTNLVGNSAFVNAINTNSIVVSASNNASSALSTANSANSNALTALNTVNNMEIGGRNLIVSNNVVNGYVNSSGVIYSTSLYRASDYIHVAPGDIITFQLWTPSSVQSWIDDTYFDSNKNYVTGYGGEYITSNHIIKTYTVPEGVAYVRMSYAWATGYKVKLEKGNKATDWTPAPEDISVYNIYTPNTTTIDGGKITTGSIKAEKIDVKDLFAQNITATGTIIGAKLVGSIFETKASDYSKDIISISYKGSGSEYLSRFYAGSINIEYDANGVYSSSFNYDNISIISNRRALHNNINPNMSVEYYNGGGNVFSQEEYFVFKEKNFEDVKIYEKVCEVNSHYDDGTQKYSDKDTSYINFLGSIRALEFKENGTALSNKYLGINANAVSATKATQDGNGNNIVDTYAVKSHTHSYLPLSGGTLTGDLVFRSGNYGSTMNSRVLQLNHIGDTTGDYYMQFNYGSNAKSYYTRLHPANVTANRYVYLPNAAGTLSIASSDIRLKDNIEDTEVDNALSVVNQMKLHSFDWNDGSNPHQKIGFVADELEEIDSRLAVGGGWDITTNPDGKEEKVMNVKTVDTFYMMGYVVKAIQELSEQIQKLKDA